MKQKTKRLLSLIMALVMAFSLAVTAQADDDGTDDTDPSDSTPSYLTLIILPLSLELAEGDMTTIEVDCMEDDSQASYTWESSNPGVVSVTGQGKRAALVRATGSGDATITVYGSIDGEILGRDTIPVYVEATATPLIVSGIGSTDVSLKVGETRNLSLSVSGGSGQYSFDWDSSSHVAIADSMRNNVAIQGATAGAGYVECLVSDQTDPTNYATVRWDVVVESAAKPVRAELDYESMDLRLTGYGTLTVFASGGSGSFSYNWWKSNLRHVEISGDGATVTVIPLTPGTDTVQVDVYDNETMEVHTLKCVVSVANNSVEFNTSASASVGSGLGLNTIAASIANEYRRQFGTELGYGASVKLSTPSSNVGAIRMQDGTQVYSSLNLVYATFSDCSFDGITAGTFSTRYTVTDGGNTIQGTITVSVSGGVGVSSVVMSSDVLAMNPYSNCYLSLAIMPSNAYYSVKWSVDDPRIATVYGNGASATVTSQGYTGTAYVYATVTDAAGAKITRTCLINVQSSSTYNPSLTLTLGSTYFGTTVSENMAKQFRNVYGYNLAETATMRFSATGNSRYGIMRLPDGSAIRANVNYTFRDWIDMYFEPLAIGTFSLPYTLAYNGKTLEGTINIEIRQSSVSAVLSQTQMTLAPYSNQSIYLTVTPANSRFSVTWRSANTDIATVSGSGANATVKTTGKIGSTVVSAVVTDRYGVETYHSCTVTVVSSASYNPSVSTTIGVSYVGTGTSDAMKAQFKSVYGIDLPGNAVISFSFTGNNQVATMRLRDGTPIKAHTNYTMSEYVDMYTDPVSVGEFSVPYMLTYNGKALSGNVIVNVNAASIATTISLDNANEYLFSSAASNGSVSSTVLASAITNATGSSWSHLRFGSTNSGVGTLYQDASRTPLSKDLRQSDLGNLYFVPSSSGGEYSIPFTVFNAAGNCIANGKLFIRVNVASNTNFTDVKDSDWFGLPVKWAVGRGITNGTTATTFEPAKTCSKAEIITFLWRAAGSPEPKSLSHFSDVNTNAYYAKATAWAAENGMVSGSVFSPDAPCTREMAVEFMWKLAGSPTAAKAAFTDVSSPAVDWAVTKGVTNGTSANGTTFNPDGICTRGQIVTFLYRAFA